MTETRSARWLPAGMLDTVITPRETSSRSRGLSVGNASRPDLDDLCTDFGIDRQLARALVGRFGVVDTVRRCEAAARRWQVQIWNLTGKDLRGVTDLPRLKWLHEIETARLQAAPRSLRLVSGDPA